MAAPTKINFDRSREFNYIAPSTVWQYFAEYDTWYVYHRDNPFISNLTVTESDWLFITGQGQPNKLLIAAALIGAVVIVYLLFKK